MKLRMVWKNMYIPSDMHWIIEIEGQRYWPVLITQYYDEDTNHWYDLPIEEES